MAHTTRTLQAQRIARDITKSVQGRDWEEGELLPSLRALSKKYK